jgi:hypothetical protein
MLAIKQSKKGECRIPFKNMGAVPLHVDVSFLNPTDDLKLTPSSMHLQK